MHAALVTVTSLALTTAARSGGKTETVDFERCAGQSCAGWNGPTGPGGQTSIDPRGGNPDGNLHTVFNNFLITFGNETNPTFVRDFTELQRFTLSVDLKIEDVSFVGTPVTRPWLVEIRDRDDAPAGYPWVSVWYLFGWIGEGDWTTWSVEIEDPDAVEMPDGWGGSGAEDPVTFEPRLPEGRTFASVLAGADEVVFTTGLPGYVFGFTDFDYRLDNITITTVEREPCIADLNGDGTVDAEDMGVLLASWGDIDSVADLDDDGVVGSSDLGLVLVDWGECG